MGSLIERRELHGCLGRSEGRRRRGEGGGREAEQRLAAQSKDGEGNCDKHDPGRQ